MKNLNEKLSDILQKALTVAEKTGEFAIEQAPLLLQEFYTWQIISNIMLMCLILIPLIPFIYFYKKADWDYNDTLPEIMSIVFGGLTFCALPFSLIGVYKLVFVIIAPKLYLIQYFIK